LDKKRDRGRQGDGSSVSVAKRRTDREDDGTVPLSRIKSIKGENKVCTNLREQCIIFIGEMYYIHLNIHSECDNSPNGEDVLIMLNHSQQYSQNSRGKNNKGI